MSRFTERLDSKKYILRYGFGFIETAIVVVMFAKVWYDFVVVHNQTSHLTGLGNLGMAFGTYLIIVMYFMKRLGGYTIGVNRKMVILAAQVSALFCADFVEIFVSMAITGQFRFGFMLFKLYAQLWLVQSLVTAVLSYFMVDIYRKVIPPLTLLEIYGSHRNNLPEKLNELVYKYKVEKSVSCDLPMEELISEMEQCDAVLLNDLPSKDKNRLLKKCFEMDKRVYITPKLSDIMVKNSEDLNLVDTPIYLFRNSGIPRWKLAVKRLFDIVSSSLVLVILSPLFAVIAFLIHHEDGGPVFFRQERVTQNGRRFMILKFRSMIVDAEKDGRPHPAGEEDPRITKIGKFIRKTRIDEFPQLVNIIKGDMSVVGPRPERWEHVEKYTQDIPEFKLRLKAKAGLTGLAQVYGKYNTSALDKLKMDLMYIESFSLFMDVQILFETVRVLFQGESTEGFTEEATNIMHDYEGI
jgi:exopolysaccharide biosynthesis polyprenyl glycosylphosphotransferase